MISGNQEAFDRVVEHLLTAKKRSVDVNGNYCLYRSPDGGACAVGALIPDELYHPDMDSRAAQEAGGGTAIYLIIDKFPGLAALFSNVNLNLLSALQRIHDDTGNWDQEGFNAHGCRELYSVSLEYNLTIPGILVRHFNINKSRHRLIE